MSISTLSLARHEAALSSWRSQYQQGVGQLRLLRSQRDSKAGDLARSQDNVDLWRVTQVLLTLVSDYARRQLVGHIEELVTMGLQTVLEDESLRFEIEISQIANKASAEWKVVQQHGDVVTSINPENWDGGGIVDLISTFLRLALLELVKPRPQGPVLLDEPAKMLSVQHSHNFAAFLKAYALRTGRQCLIVTHNTTLAESGDAIYWVEKDSARVSHARQVTAGELAELFEAAKREEAAS